MNGWSVAALLAAEIVTVHAPALARARAIGQEAPQEVACTVGAQIDVLWNGTWYPATVKSGPNSTGACQIGYDGYGTHWDEWVGANRMRPRGDRRPAGTTTASIANTAVPWIDLPPLGVYGCSEARATYGAPGCVQSTVGCLGMQVELRPAMMFGLLDRATYADFDGHTGHYTYDGRTGVVTMTDGTRRGWRYKRSAATAFRALDTNGAATPYTCPLEKGKDPRRHPW